MKKELEVKIPIKSYIGGAAWLMQQPKEVKKNEY
jgi:hypothetical protein